MRTDECEYAKGDHEAPSKDNADDGVGTGVYYCMNRISEKLRAWDVRASEARNVPVSGFNHPAAGRDR